MKVLTDNKYYGQIADVIREQNGTNNTYTPPQMVSALKDLFYEEVEGVPPITFQGIGENLLDYRIDGASGGVGDRTSNLFDKNNPTMLTELYISVTGLANVTSSNSRSIVIPCTPATTYSIKFKYETYTLRIASFSSYPTVNKVGNDVNNVANGTPCNNASYTTSETANYLLIFCYNVATHESSNYSIDEFFSEIIVSESQIPLPYEPYGYKVPVMVEGKNLLQNTATSQTVNGVTFTVNNDKSITCNGTATGTAAITINTIFSINSTKISGCPMGGSWSSFELDLLNINTNNVDVMDTGNGAVIQNENSYRVRIRIASGYTCNNLTFYPMIRKADIEDDTYEPYIEPTITNIYLNTPIEAKANIPSEYEEVEYIESTGTQYIDTNYTPVQGDDLEFKNVTINTFNGALFSAGIESYQLILLGLGSVCYYKYFQTGNAVASSFSTITNGNIKVLNGNLYINNVLKAEADYGGAVNTTLNIFQRANNTSNLIGKIGEIIISNNGIIKRDFIPCYRKSDNVAGLYDLVNNTFYTNQGTGNFIVGPIKENESISLSDTNVNIPTIRGTNVLSVDTTVQPSNVYIKSRHESSYETAMRERYEEAQAQLDALESGGE